MHPAAGFSGGLMGGILLLAGFEFCGVAAAWKLAQRRGLVTRVWLGLSLGLVMMMWFPALFAFALDFTAAANWCGLALAVLSAAAPWFTLRINEPVKTADIPWKLLAALVIPLAILGIYLQHTHTIREVEGALYVGQSTYGDLCLHLGIATGMVDGAFPPTYTLLPGAELGYPFLSDTLCSSMLLFGTSLRTAYVVSGSLMLVLVFTGYAVFAWELTKSRMAVAIAYVIMFINGGFGFIYVLDGAAGDSSMLREVFTGFYRTPTNMTDKNLRWVNVICDMLIPQRTLTAGWTVLMPALYMLTLALKERDMRTFVCLGLWAGAMPMIHTHSFMGLGLISVGAMVYCVIRTAKEHRLDILKKFLVYGGIAVILAAPQLLRWTFPQTIGGGSLSVRFNWVNNNGDNTFIDGYFWFWIKNVGVVYLMVLPAAMNMNRTGKAIAWGALVIYIIAEIFQFQPNPYDNNKLFYVAYIAVTPMVGAFAVRLWNRLKGLRIRVGMLAVFILLATLSGALSIGREVVSEYRLFSASEAAAGEFAVGTEKDAVFLTGTQHNNPITALGGRQIICGTPNYLYFHGIDYTQEYIDVKRMLETPGQYPEIFEKYGVDYVYISSYERGSFDVDEWYFVENCEAVFSEGNVTIYKFTN